MLNIRLHRVLVHLCLDINIFGKYFLKIEGSVWNAQSFAINILFSPCYNNESSLYPSTSGQHTHDVTPSYALRYKVGSLKTGLSGLSLASLGPQLAVIPWVTTQCLRSWDSKWSNSAWCLCVPSHPVVRRDDVITSSQHSYNRSTVGSTCVPRHPVA